MIQGYQEIQIFPLITAFNSIDWIRLVGMIEIFIFPDIIESIKINAFIFLLEENICLPDDCESVC